MDIKISCSLFLGCLVTISSKDCNMKIAEVIFLTLLSRERTDSDWRHFDTRMYTKRQKNKGSHAFQPA